MKPPPIAALAFFGLVASFFVAPVRADFVNFETVTFADQTINL